MAEDALSNEFCWDTVFIKVEDEVFCVPQREFVQSSEVFAGMFLLPSGPATCSEGQDKEHPIVLPDGYKKDEFACLLRVLYPRPNALIYGLSMKQEQWVSVLKLSSIWIMKEIRQYAIDRLSTDVVLSPIEKILLARAYRVPAWLEEAVTSLATSISKPTLDDLATLGWETAARIVWIWYHSPNVLNTLCFRRDAIKCAYCLSSSSLITSPGNCGHISADNTELTFPGPGLPSSNAAERQVRLAPIQCKLCGGNPFSSLSFVCGFCANTSTRHSNVRIQNKALQEMIEEMFGAEIKDLL